MSDQNKSFISRFFGFIWGFVVGIYRTLVILAFIIGGVALWAAFKGNVPAKMDSNIALVVAPTGFLVDMVDRDPGEEFFENLAGDPPAQSSVRDIVLAFERGAQDARIPFAVLKLDGLWGSGLAQLQEIGAAMKKFQASGKKIIAYGPWYDQSQYYAASQADEVVLDPLGMIALEGFSAYTNFYKEGLDKLGVEMNVFRVGEFKSAVEPFTRNDMSPEAKAANVEWLGDLWREYGRTVSGGRKLKDTAADDYVNGLRAALEKNNGDTALYAKDSGLATHVETLTAFRARMAETVGIDDDHGSFRQINYHDYLSRTNHENGKAMAADVPEKSKIALISVQGEIVDGEGERGYAGGDTISDLLDDARRDNDIAAVVLRVDSPGGSVWASEQIRRAVQNLKTEGKPVVASMGNVAASGGYWVSMDADEVWAHDNTITGSIGIFGLIPTLDKALAKLGIHTDGVGTTPLAGALRLDRPISADMASIIQSQINKGYRDFIEGVAMARKLPVDRVNEIARGRVWSGEDAKALGLVDQLGGLDQAAASAARLAKLGDWELEEFTPDRGWTSKFFAPFFGSAMSRIGVPGLSRFMRDALAQQELTQVLRTFNDPRGIYAHCFCTPASGAGRPH